MSPDTTSKNRRVLLWGVLGVALAAATGLLAVAVGRGGEGPSRYYIRILNERGQPVPTAECRVHRSATFNEWDRKSSVLLLSGGQTHSVIVRAQGYRITRVRGIDRDRNIVLKRGLPVVFRARGDATLPAGERVVLLRIQPVFQQDPEEDAGIRTEFDDIVKLLDVRTPKAEKHLHLPHEGWGFPVTLDVAAKGVLFPDPGKYVVHWGILDKKAGTWFSLGEAAVVHGSNMDEKAETESSLVEDGYLPFEVVESREPQVVTLEINKDAMQGTRRGLRRRIELIERREADDARRRAEGALPSSE